MSGGLPSSGPPSGSLPSGGLPSARLPLARRVPLGTVSAGLVAALSAFAFAVFAMAGAGSAPAQEESGVGDAAGDAAPTNDAEAQIDRYRDRAERSKKPRDLYNLGTAYLAAWQWPEARTELARAADEGEGKVERFARYNLGLANAMEGHPAGDAPEDERHERLVSARDAFREVLRGDPDDLNARWNLELVNRWLEETSAGGGGSSQDEDEEQGGSGGSAGQPGPAEPGGEAPSLTREEAEQLLQQAAGAEDEVRDKTLRRGRLRDPVVERNW